MYIPIIKTSPAEIKAFKNLTNEEKKYIYPLFELTKGRTHKKNYPEGRLEKSLEMILDAHPNKFFLDITSHDDLINSELESFFDESQGYEKWVSFIASTGRAKDIIPVVQIDADSLFSSDINLNKEAKLNVSIQTQKLEEICGKVALRFNLEVSSGEINVLIESVVGGLQSVESLFLFIDAEYIRPNTSSRYCEVISKTISNILHNYSIKNIVVSSSSFPKSVTETNYGEFNYGFFDLEEIKLYNKLTKVLESVSIIYSDYALIHPRRYDVKGGSWIPRVDIPLETSLYYYRFRREENGYVKAAKEAVNDIKYKQLSLDSWGKKQVELASNDSPKGLAPSYWISVRANIHMVNQINKFKN